MALIVIKRNIELVGRKGEREREREGETANVGCPLTIFCGGSR